MTPQPLSPSPAAPFDYARFYESCRTPCREIFDLPYASLSPSQKLDLYLPPDRTGPFPVLVLIHGGAFMFGDKREHPFQPNPIAFLALRRGYALAALNYRMSGEALFPALVQDVKTAVRWLRAHAGVYHLDPSWFAAWGDSAGGYLASMLGTSAGIPELEGTELGWAGHSSALQAVMDWYGPTDMLLMDRQLREAGLYFKDGPDHDAPDSPESRLVGFPIQEQPERLRLANPITYIRKEVPPPPFLIYHGSRDRIVPAGQSRILVEALLPQLGPQRLVVDLSMPVDHGGQPDFYLPANIERMLNFLDRSLGR